MTKLSEVPLDLDSFLIWLKHRTETAWASYPTTTLEQFEVELAGGSSWRAGTKWLAGLQAGEIAALEEKWGLQFPDDYRRFLSVLNAPDRGRYSVGWSEEPPYGLVEEEQDQVSFLNWHIDDQIIANAFAWPLEGLLTDVVENALWLPGWGEKPTDEHLVREKISNLIAAAPKLIPLTGHRYLLDYPIATGFPVLSIWKSDIISYGSDLRSFLLLELADLLEMNRVEILDSINRDFNEELTGSIPFWGELMLMG